MNILIPMVLVLILGMMYGYFSERKAFNKGRCPKCYGELKHFDNDSQGGRGYVCDSRCGYYTWVSYPFIERRIN